MTHTSQAKQVESALAGSGWGRRGGFALNLREGAVDPMTACRFPPRGKLPEVEGSAEGRAVVGRKGTLSSDAFRDSGSSRLSAWQIPTPYNSEAPA